MLFFRFFQKKQQLSFMLCSVAFLGIISTSALAITANPDSHYQAGKKALNAEDFQGAIEHFYRLQREHPSDSLTQRATLDLAYAFYRLGDFTLAIAEGERFIDSNVGHPNLPFAHYVTGLSYYTETLKLVSAEYTDSERITATGQEALDYFGILIERFPDSEYTDHAKLRSNYLLEKLMASQHEMKTITPNRLLSADFNNGSDLKKVDWIKQQAPEYYTLELVSHPSLIDVLDLIDHNGLINQAMIYETPRQNGTIYTLLYGLFESRKIAMDVGARLPREVLDIQPIIKTMAEIHHNIDTDQSVLAEHSKPLRKTAKPENDRLVQKSTAILSNLTPKPEIKAKAISKPSLQQNTADAARILQENWLMTQNPKHYTLQLAGMEKQDSILKFIRKRHLDKKTAARQVAYYHSLKKEGDWYAVVYNTYPNWKKASLASKDITTKLGVKQPWIRRIGDIQKSIAEARASAQ